MIYLQGAEVKYGFRKIFISFLILVFGSVACSTTETTTEPEPVIQKEKTKEVENSPVESYEQPVAGDLVLNTLNVGGIERSYLVQTC